MSATARLWRRAPLWRLLLAATAAFGVLAALYPTPLPHFRRFAAPATPAAPVVPAQPRGSVEAVDTPTEPTLHDSLTVAGRTVPLPVGDWHELVAARAEEAAEISDVMLGRWQGGALTGLLEVMATTGPADNNERAGVIKDCTSYGNYVVKWSDAGQTCWLVRKMDVPASGIDPHQSHTMVGASLARVRALGVTVPATLSMALWSHADRAEMMNYELMVANARDPHDPSAAMASLATWMGRFAPLLRRGFDGKLDAGAAAGRSRDPGAPATATRG